MPGKKGLYANINARKKAGTSRPKSKSTISSFGTLAEIYRHGRFEQIDLVDDDDEVQDSTVIFPTDNWKETWDLWVLVLILYSAVMVPSRICFNKPTNIL